jgi:hypothetical protein
VKRHWAKVAKRLELHVRKALPILSLSPAPVDARGLVHAILDGMYGASYEEAMDTLSPSLLRQARLFPRGSQQEFALLEASVGRAHSLASRPEMALEIEDAMAEALKDACGMTLKIAITLDQVKIGRSTMRSDPSTLTVFCSLAGARYMYVRRYFNVHKMAAPPSSTTLPNPCPPPLPSSTNDSFNKKKGAKSVKKSSTSSSSAAPEPTTSATDTLPPAPPLKKPSSEPPASEPDNTPQGKGSKERKFWKVNIDGEASEEFGTMTTQKQCLLGCIQQYFAGERVTTPFHPSHPKVNRGVNAIRGIIGQHVEAMTYESSVASLLMSAALILAVEGKGEWPDLTWKPKSGKAAENALRNFTEPFMVGRVGRRKGEVKAAARMKGVCGKAMTYLEGVHGVVFARKGRLAGDTFPIVAAAKKMRANLLRSIGYSPVHGLLVSLRVHVRARLARAGYNGTGKPYKALEDAVFNAICGVTKRNPKFGTKDLPTPLPPPSAATAMALSDESVIYIIDEMRSWLQTRPGSPMDPFYTKQINDKLGDDWEGTLRVFKLGLREDGRKGVVTRVRMLQEREEWHSELDGGEEEGREGGEEAQGLRGCIQPFDDHVADEEEEVEEDLEGEDEEGYDDEDGEEDGEEDADTMDPEPFKGKRFYPRAFSICPFYSTSAKFIQIDTNACQQMFIENALGAKYTEGDLPPGYRKDYSLDTIFYRKVRGNDTVFLHTLPTHVQLTDTLFHLPTVLLFNSQCRKYLDIHEGPQYLQMEFLSLWYTSISGERGNTRLLS